MTHGHLQRRLGLAALLAVTLALPVSARAACVGDCNGDFTITVNELVTGVNIALGNSDIASLPGVRYRQHRGGRDLRAHRRRSATR